MKEPKMKSVPMRTCITCKEKLPKREMVRVVRDVEGNVFVDPKGKIRGRGANLSPKIECLQQALDKSLIVKALKLEAAITEDKREELAMQFKAVLHNREFRKGNEKVVLRINKEDLVK